MGGGVEAEMACAMNCSFSFLFPVHAGMTLCDSIHGLAGTLDTHLSSSSSSRKYDLCLALKTIFLSTVLN